MTPPLIKHAIMSYFLGACFPTHSLARNTGTLKATFTIYSLTPPPSSSNKDYQNYLRSTNDNEADFLLDQPETKQAAVQKKCVIGGKQEELDDVLSTIGDFFEFSKYMVKFDINSSDTYPLILFRLSQFTEYIYDSEFKALLTSHLTSSPWLPHALISHLQQYFQTLTPVANIPVNLRTTISGEPLPPRTFRDAELLFPKIMDIVHSCVISNNMGTISH